MSRIVHTLYRACGMLLIVGMFGLLFGQEGADLLIITHDDFAPIIQSLAQWKYMQGLPTKVVKLSDIGINPDTTEIRNYIVTAYNTWNPRPKYVLLVGSTNRIPCFRCSGAPNDPSDNNYANITGDYQAELAVGRFAVDGAASCSTLVAKTLGYECSPVMQDNWFKKATLIVTDDSYSDPYYFTLEYARTQLAAHEYQTIDFFSSLAGHTAVDVINAIDDGRAIVAYRGTAGPGGWHYFVVSVSQVNNGWKLPVIISGTCRTGYFASQAAMCNTWTQGGSAQNPKGAVAFFGTSTIVGGRDRPGSWCRGYASKGIFRAIFEEDIYNLGYALVSAKDYMAENHLNPQAPSYPYTDIVHQEYDGWNLVGDPTLELWTEIPQHLHVEHPNAIAVGVPTDIAVSVVDVATGDPIPGALVTLYKPLVESQAPPQVYRSAFTEEGGTVVFDSVVVPTPGILRVTATYRDHQTNYIPYRGSIQVTTMTEDPLALAYNGNRHLVRTPNTEELHLVYARGGEVVYGHSCDGGTNWDMPETIGSGKFPAIALAVDYLPSVTWTDAEGGLWYRRKTSATSWSDVYHLDDPTSPSDRHLNSPPAIAIHGSNPNTVHILVTRSGVTPAYNATYSHTVEDFSFPINNPGLGWFEIIEEKLGPLNPPLRTFPSIARCEVNNSLHATWQRQDTICYATKPRDDWWVNWGPQFGDDGLQSAHPFVETYGDSVFIVWQNEAAEDVYRAANWIYNLPPEFTWVAFTQTANLASLYPVNASGLFTIYAEEPTTDNPYDIYYKIRPYDDRINISNTPHKSCYPQSAARFTIGADYHYTDWLEGDAAPYEIKFRKMQHLDPPDQAYLSTATGQNSPSPYLVARDSFIDDWQIPVDVGNTATSYRFPLTPGYAYKAKAVIYHEASGPWSARVEIDNNLQFSVTYDANMPETLECWIPPALYEDSVLSISFNRIAGDFVAIGPIYIYRYELDGGEVGGGPMSQDGSSIGRSMVAAFPNPFTDRLTITCQVTGQHNTSLKVYDVTGRLVKQFDLRSNEILTQVVWDGIDERGRAVPQGVYFLRLDNPDMDDIICQKVLSVK